MVEVKQVEFIYKYNFLVRVDGVECGCCHIGSIEQSFFANGRARRKPVTMIHSPRKGARGFAQIFGNRPWQKRDIMITEWDRGMNQILRVIRMKKCKITSVKIGEHDSYRSEVVLDEIKFIPGAVNIQKGWASKDIIF